MKLIVKGILVWFTALALILFICGIDSIFERGFQTIVCWIMAWLIPLIICVFTVSEDELFTVSGAKKLGIDMDE